MLIRFAFGVIVRFFFSTSTARSLEVSFKPLPGMSRSARSALRSSCQMFATCWWWNRCSKSAWSCRRPLRAPLESELLVFIGITTSFQVRTWIVDTLITHTQETLRITDLDTFGDVRSTRRNKTVCCFFFVRAPICAWRSREPSERREDGKTNEVNDLYSFRGHAADVVSSCSRATVQQTSYWRDSALEVLYFVLPQTQITFIRGTPTKK